MHCQHPSAMLWMPVASTALVLSLCCLFVVVIRKKSVVYPMSPPIQTLSPNPNPKETWTGASRRRNSRRRKSKSKSKSNSNSNSNPLEWQTLTLEFPIPWSPVDSQDDPILQSNLLAKVQSTTDKLKSSQFYSQFLAQLQSPQIRSGLNNLLSFNAQFDLIMYGIGSIDSCETPRLQLSLALLLYEQLNPCISSIQVFDPIITGTELAVIEKLGVQVMRMDERGRRQVKAPTLFFMPHCEVLLYDNLLGVNWGCESLSRMAILGNSFGEYERRGLGFGGLVEGTGRRVIGSRGFVNEVRMGGFENGDDGFFTAFHNISWHFFLVTSDADISLI